VPSLANTLVGAEGTDTELPVVKYAVKEKGLSLSKTAGLDLVLKPLTDGLNTQRSNI
jgi:hypothetical protein